MVKEKSCEHERILPVYVRDQELGLWHSSKKITGNMMHMCLKCGKIFKKSFEEVE